MKKIFFIVIVIALVIISSIILLESNQTEPSNLDILKKTMSKKDSASADHSKFAVLQKKFDSPQQVTEACLSCHTERHKEVMRSSHWNWSREQYIEGRGIVNLGKKNAINNFCIGVEGNEKSCGKCHVGFGVSDSVNDNTNAKNIDCMVCHDNTETYAKANEMGGYPDNKLDLSEIARHVGKSKRSNCGVCHFFGGGGNNVKHGDLDKAMFESARDIDVHMDVSGPDLQCAACHVTKKHKMLGRVYSLSSNNQDRSTCEQCHTASPHNETILNEHTVKVACQTCHIPVYAKANSTKMEWDWSTAGKLKDGEPYEEDDSLGNHTYLSIKGTFKWDRNVKPDYIWFNGTAEHYLLGDSIKDTTKPVEINKLNGSYSDRASKIIPVKIHNALQPFDQGTGMLIQPKLFSDNYGEGAFWKDFNWKTAAAEGMKDVNLPFSGKLSFIKTIMYWPVNHMVSTKEKSLQCVDCHTRNNSRLAGLKDFYMPARDYNPIIETGGTAVIILTLLGTAAHGILRIKFSGKRKKQNEK
ncbi:MAG: tetrathionate reductase family octaheme c-type cytochrome [Bacteroidetes bacterium]|nr:tetrathionate reductase family octaheme c-type cytochrome [Bacteroidota bacterium]